ncbi:hypothetical protein PILCRDRAFT_85888 [Piloderma croceum F 1598]|uniref:Uncharacterized protein n=1 Tax=Piloderma croceum (strain F 1598) TaxID=765440 RepID=A0A0C3BLU6_PILCF|nr:hypothetical protein PILCRDRAFT_85888 [Piloderma croceum F 1598]
MGGDAEKDRTFSGPAQSNLKKFHKIASSTRNLKEGSAHQPAAAPACDIGTVFCGYAQCTYIHGPRLKDHPRKLADAIRELIKQHICLNWQAAEASLVYGCVYFIWGVIA